MFSINTMIQNHFLLNRLSFRAHIMKLPEIVPAIVPAFTFYDFYSQQSQHFGKYAVKQDIYVFILYYDTESLLRPQNMFN